MPTTKMVLMAVKAPRPELPSSRATMIPVARFATSIRPLNRNACGSRPTKARVLFLHLVDHVSTRRTFRHLVLVSAARPEKPTVASSGPS